jgi:hypothetical protein
MATYSFFRLYAWANDTKQSPVINNNTPVTSFTSISLTENLSAVGEIAFTCFLGDPKTLGLGKGHYFELYAGEDQNPAQDLSSRSPWMSGEIQSIVRDPSQGGFWNITGATALIKLSTFFDLEKISMNFTTDNKNKKNYKKGYRNVLFAFNGLDGSGGMGDPRTNQKPGTQGIYTGTGWRVVWKQADGKVPDEKSIAGYGDSWEVAYQNVLVSTQRLATRYNGYFRMQKGSKANNGVIEFGPLGDDSGLNIWGGKPLEDKVKDTTDGHDANTLDAQLQSLAVISAATYEDDMGDVVNTIWPIGHRGGGTFLTLSHYFPPIKDKKGNVNALSEGGKDYYYKWTEHSTGRVYWKVHDTVWVNNTQFIGKVDATRKYRSESSLSVYRLVAVQNNDGTFSYGLMNEYSVSLYGVRQQDLMDHSITDHSELLSAAIGAAEYNAEPTPSWTFAVKHPMIADKGVPIYVQPGQTIDVNYEGTVHKSIYMDADGTITPGPDISYLKFPKSSDVCTRDSDGNITSGCQTVNGIHIDGAMYARMRRIAKVEQVWTANGYSATYTLGKGRFRGEHFADHIAKEFEHHKKHSSKGPAKKALKHANLDHIKFLFEYGAHVDHQNGSVILPTGAGIASDPGGIVVADVKTDEIFFDDHHHVTFSFKLDDDRQILDFWFAKPTTSHLTDYDVADDDTYGIIRFCGASANQRGGFFIKNPWPIGSTPPKGKSNTTGSGFPVGVGYNLAKRLHKKPGFKAGINYTVTIEWSGGHYHVHVKYREPNAAKNASVNRLYSTWKDGNQYITQWGAIGWHGMDSGGGDSIQVWGLQAHPLHKKHAHTVHESGNGGIKGLSARTETITHTEKEGIIGKDAKGYGGHGFRMIEWDDDSDGVNSKHYLTHVTHAAATQARGHLVVSSHRNSVTMPFNIAQGSTFINLDSKIEPVFPHNGLPPNTIKEGYTISIWDGDNSEHISADSLMKGNGGWIKGIYLKEPCSYSHLNTLTNSIEISWDHLDSPENFGHRIFSHYLATGKQSTTGYYKALLPADLGLDQQEKTFMIGPDGKPRVQQDITDAEGNIIPLAPLVTDADHFALGLEGHGVILFDAGEYNSTTQRAYVYDELGNRTSTIAPADVDSNGKAIMFTGDPATTQASWVSQAIDSTKGEADSLLQLTTPTSGGTVLWQDTQILEEPDPNITAATPGYVLNDDNKYAKQRKHKVTKDVTIHLPIYIEPSKFTTSALTLGAKTTVAAFAPAGQNYIEVDHNPDTFNSTGNDKWIVNTGHANQETLTVTGVDSEAYRLLLQSPLAYNHERDEEVHMTFWGATKVYSAGTLEGKTALDDALSKVDAIAVGFQDTNGNWYRGWWGDPAWNHPYTTDVRTGTTQICKFLGGFGGAMGLAVGDFSDLFVKTSHLGMYKRGQPIITIKGVEMAIHSISTSSPLTVFFDAHEHGVTTKKKKIPADNVGGAAIGAGVVGHKHKNPSGNADAHMHSDLFMWAEKNVHNANAGKWRIHWEHDTGPGTGPASLVLHNNKKYTIYAGPRADGTSGGASEDHLNVGIPALPITSAAGAIATLAAGVGDGNGDQTSLNNVKGHYVVFNTNSSGYFLADPGVVGGKVWVPGYVAGSPSQQTQGFAVVTEKFNWQAKRSGGAVLQGPHADLFKVAKIGNVPDAHTGELHIMGHGPHTKHQGSKTRKGSVSPKHHHPTVPTNTNHHNIVYSMDSRGKSPNSNQQGTFHATKKQSTATTVRIETQDGKLIGSLPKVGSTVKNVYINQVNPHDYIVWDDGSKSGYAAGIYAYKTNGTHSPWLTAGSKPNPAGYIGGTAPSAPLSVGPVYTQQKDENNTTVWRFDPHKDDSLGFHLIGRVAEQPDPHTKQYHLEGAAHPNNHKSSGVHYAKNSHGRAHMNKHHPVKKQRKKKANKPVNQGGMGGNAKKHTIFKMKTKTV